MEEKLDKLKKDELIELVKELKSKEEEKGNEEMNSEKVVEVNYKAALYKKIQTFREEIRNRNFILDKELPSNLGGGEYVSIEQYYQAVQEVALSVGLDFSFEVINVDRLDLGAFKPATGSPQNIATISCVFTLTDIDTGEEKRYCEMSQGSDSVDKAVNGASTFAFRNWFDKNFTPKIFNGKEVNFGDEDNNVSLDGVNIPNKGKAENSPRVFINTGKKEEIKKEVVQTSQGADEEDIKKLTSLIYTYREISGDETKGAKTLKAILDGTITDTEVLSKTLSFENAIEKLEEKENE